MKRLFFLLYIMALAVVFPSVAVTAEASDFSDRVGNMAEITGIRDSSSDDKTRIVIDASKPVTYKKMVLSEPDRVVIDIANAWLSPKLDRQLALDSPFVGNVKIAQFDPQTVRVVVETKVGRNDYKVFALNSKRRSIRVFLDHLK